MKVLHKATQKWVNVFPKAQSNGKSWVYQDVDSKLLYTKDEISFGVEKTEMQASVAQMIPMKIQIGVKGEIK